MSDGHAELRVSTSPRMTWLWAPDDSTTSRVRQILDAGGHFWQPAARGGTIFPNVTDVEIGVAAFSACEALAKAGFRFTWHEDEPIANHDNWPSTLFGMPGSGPSRVEDQTGGSA